jgi:hypothetical protein
MPQLMLCRLLLLLSCVLPARPASILEDATSMPAALELLAAPNASPGEPDVLLALERGWFDAAKRVLTMMRERGEPVASLTEVRKAATQIRDRATDVINLMRTGANTEETVVTTAFQWAQRPEFVYLNVKFSSRIDGPVTCLNVDNERIVFGNDTLLFEGVGRQKPKTFRLNLTFFGAILPEQSSWAFSSVGRMSLTIAKASNETWPRLLQSKTKPKNMHAWYDRQQILDAEVKKEAEARKAAREAAAKEADKAKAKEGDKSPPAPAADKTSDAAAEDAPPTPPRPADEPASPKPAKKGASKKKKEKSKGKKAAKDEV